MKSRLTYWNHMTLLRIKAIVVGRSGGAIIGLELAATLPEVIDFLIVHEAPVIEMLPKVDAEKWRSFFNDVYIKSQHEGSQAAQSEFMVSLINVPDSPLPTDLNDRISGNVDFFFKHEFRAFFEYLPNIESIRKNSIHLVTAMRRDSDNAYYVQATVALASRAKLLHVRF
jgi:pimeloyl-ACP methyl ester carboxylesterase